MGFTEKIEAAKKTDWITKDLSPSEIKTTIELARISAKIERCRIELGMTQKEFARYMNVSQGMVSKWESRDYNFTIRSLNELCEKLNLELDLSLISQFERPIVFSPVWKFETPSKSAKYPIVGENPYEEGIA